MGVSAVWDNEAHTIIRYIYEGKWTWDEWYIVADQVQEMLKSVDHQVAMIIDTRTSSLPPGAISRFRTISSRSDKVHLVVMVGGNAFVAAIFRIVQKVVPPAGHHFTMASSLEEARAVIAKRNPPAT